MIESSFLMGALTLLCSITIAGIAYTLMMWPSYDDGVFGKAALFLLALGSAVPACEVVVYGAQYDVLPTTMLIYIGMAAFMVRHFVRFLRYNKGAACSKPESSMSYSHSLQPSQLSRSRAASRQKKKRVAGRSVRSA